MIINFCDEMELLNQDTMNLMEVACGIAFERETGIKDAPIEISVTVVSADEIKEINAEYRGIDKVTDVLSFPQYEDAQDIACEIDELDESIIKEGFNVPVGDVVLCYDKALSQAEEYGTGKDRELMYLFVHSICHLLGYDHMEEDEKSEMRLAEEYVMNKINLPARED